MGKLVNLRGTKQDAIKAMAADIVDSAPILRCAIALGFTPSGGLTIWFAGASTGDAAIAAIALQTHVGDLIADPGEDDEPQRTA